MQRQIDRQARWEMCELFSKLKRLLGDSILYAFMSVGTKIIAFLMIGVFQDQLEKVGFGILANMDSALSLTSLMIIFGTDAALAFYYYREKNDPDRQLRYIQNVMGFRLSVAIFFLLVSIVFGNPLAAFITNSAVPEQYYVTLVLVMAINLIDSIIVLTVTVYRYEMRTIRVILLTISKLSLYALFSYLFMVFWSGTVESVMWGRLLALVLILLVSGRSIISYLKVKFDVPIWKEIITYAAPLVPSTLAFWIIGSSNRFFITYLSDKDTALYYVGIFDTAFKFAAVISLLTYGIQMAWRPFAMQMKDEKGSTDLFGKVYLGVFVMGIVGVMAITTLAPLLKVGAFFVKPAYFVSIQYIGFLSLSAFINFYYIIICSGVFFQENTKIVTIAFVFAALLYVGLILGLHPLFGIWGVVVSNIIAYLVPTVIIFKKSQEVFYIPVAYGKLVFLFFQTVISMVGIVYLQNNSFSVFYQVIPWFYFIGSLWICRVDQDLRTIVNRQVQEEEN